MARQFTVSFRINGAMDGSLQAALNAAANAMRRLGQSARAASAAAQASRSGLAGMAAGLTQLQTAAQRYKQLQDALKQSTLDFSRSTAGISAARSKYEQDAAAVDRLKQRLLELKTAQQQAATTKASSNAALKQMRQDLQDLKRAYDVARRAGDSVKMTSLDAQIRATQAALSSQQEKVRQAAEAYKQLSAQLKQTRTDLQAANSAAAKSGQDLNAARSNAERLKQTFQQQLTALNQLKAQLSAAGFNVSNFAASEARLEAEINRVNAALRQQAQLAATAARSQAATQELAMSGANLMGSIYSAQQALSPFTTATEKAVEFERVMSEVKALTQMDNLKAGRLDVVEREMSQLTAQAKELGATTIYTAQQVGEAQAYIARTGWNTNKILASTPHFLKLAASGHMDMARAADIATNIMTGFGISADQAEHVADVLAYTTTHSNQNLEEMGEAMKYAAPVARMFGASLEETAAMTKFMADAGIKGSMAGTSMRQTMLRLVAPPKKATKAMENMGLTVDDANAAWQNANAIAKEYGITMDESLTPGRQMLSIVKQIDEKMAGKSAHEKMAAFSAITGVNAVSGAMNIFSAGAKSLDEFTTALENCDGALEQTYGVMTKNTYGALKSMESAWEAVQLSIGSAISPLVRGAAETFTPLLTSFSQFIDRNQGVVVAIAGTVAALSGLMITAAGVKLAFAGFSFVTSSFALATSAITAFRMGLAGIAVEATGVQAVLAGMGLRLASLRTAMAGMFAAGGLAATGGWSVLFAKISAAAVAARVAVVGFFSSLSASSIAASVTATLSSIGTAIMGVARAAMAFALSPVGAALMALALAGLYCYQNWDKVGPALSQVAGIITGALGPAIQTIQAAWQSLSTVFESSGISAAISALADIVGGTLVQAFVGAAGIIATTIAVIIRGIADLIKTIADLGSGLADAIGKIADGDFSGAFEGLKSTASKTFDDIKLMGEHAFDGVKTGALATRDAIETVRTGAATAQVQKAQPLMVEGVFGGIKNLQQQPTQVVQQAAPAVQQPAPVIQQAAPVVQQQPPVIEAPKIEIPKIDAPKVEVPKVEVPKIEIPKTDAPKIEVPKIEVPPQAQQAAPAVQQATQQQPPIDTTQLQAGLDAAGTSAQNAGTQIQNVGTGIQTLVTNAQTAGAAIQTTGAALQVMGAAVVTTGVAFQVVGAIILTTGTAAQALGAAMLATGAASQSLGSSMLATGAAVQAFGAAAAGACAGTSALGSAAVSAAGAISGLGSAAQAACAQLASAGANAAAAVSAAAASAGKPVAANYQGGIYKKGAFLTTFAEKSPEAAIPLDGSKRAKDLWTRAGEMLGILPKTTSPKFDPTITAPPFNPSIKLPEGQQISYHGERQLPTRDETRRKQLPEIFTAPPKLPERIQQRQPQLPKINFPTVTTPPFAPTEKNSSTFGNVFTKLGGALLDKIQSSKFGQILGNIFPTGVDQTTRWSPYQSTVNLPTFNPKITTPPFAPTENNSSTFGNVFTKLGGALLDKIQSSKFGQILGNIFPTGVDQTTRWSPYQSTVNLPTFNPQFTTPPFAPENNDAPSLARLHENLARSNEAASFASAPINFTINVTVNGGGADVEQQTRRGIEQALPTIRNFADEWRHHMHERARVSYA